MYEIIKRHGETYVYQGQTCIAIATAENEAAVEELVRKSNLGIQWEQVSEAFKKLFASAYAHDGKFYIPSFPEEEAHMLRALLNPETTETTS